MSQIVDYDLANYKLNLRPEFNLNNFMSKMTEQNHLTKLDFDAFSQFGNSLAQETALQLD